MSNSLTKELINSLEEAGYEGLRKQLLGEVFYNQIINCATTVKKAKLMKSEYSRAIHWLDGEISRSDASRKETLEVAKANVQKASAEIDDQLVVLKTKMKDLGYGFVYDIADVVSQF